MSTASDYEHQRMSSVDVGQVWRHHKEPVTDYRVAKVGARKATFIHDAATFKITATVWIGRLLRDPEWTLVRHSSGRTAHESAHGGQDAQ